MQNEDIDHCYTNLPAAAPGDHGLELNPQEHSHYVGDKELQVFNREQAQYESAKAAKASGYAIRPENQPALQGYSDLGRLNREHDEYESAKFARIQATYDDLPT